MDPMLQLDQKFKHDESISNYETYAFYPISRTQLNNPGSITINVQNSDCFYHPARNCLQFEGVIESTGEIYTNASIISLANNGIMYLFDNIKYLLSGSEIESVFNPGHASNIIGLAKYSSSYKIGLKQCWVPDTSNLPADTNTGFKTRRDFILNSDPIGSFRFTIPLEHIFGFCDDYKKVLYGFQHSLVLTRSSSDDNAFFKHKNPPANVTVPPGKVNLTAVRWMLPRCSPSDIARYDLYKQIKAEIILDVGFRMRQCISTTVQKSTQFTWRMGIRSSPESPRHIFLTFQTNRDGNQEINNTVYDHCDLQSAHILLNGDRYPLNDFTLDFSKNHFDTIYGDFTDFIERFYHLDKMITCTSIDPTMYKSLYPILYFDVSKQSERLKSGVTDITVQCTFKNNPDETTTCHAVMISDRQLRFKSDGNKMVVLY